METLIQSYPPCVSLPFPSISLFTSPTLSLPAAVPPPHLQLSNLSVTSVSPRCAFRASLPSFPKLSAADSSSAVWENREVAQQSTWIHEMRFVFPGKKRDTFTLIQSRRADCIPPIPVSHFGIPIRMELLLSRRPAPSQIWHAWISSEPDFFFMVIKCRGWTWVLLESPRTN